MSVLIKIVFANRTYSITENMIKGLDDDEIEFLDLVDRTKLAADRRKTLEEEKELNDYRNRVATLQEKTLDQKLQSEINTSKLKTPSNNRTSQTKLLKGVIVAKNENVKRKATNMDDSTAKKAKLEMESKNAETEKKDTGDVAAKVEKKEEKKPENDRKTNSTNSTDVDPNGGLQCIGILPGLGYYEESSSDECSSNSDMDSPVPSAIQLDLLGRKVVKKEKET